MILTIHRTDLVTLGLSLIAWGINSWCLLHKFWSGFILKPVPLMNALAASYFPAALLFCMLFLLARALTQSRFLGLIIVFAYVLIAGCSFGWQYAVLHNHVLYAKVALIVSCIIPVTLSLFTWKYGKILFLLSALITSLQIGAIILAMGS